MKFKNFLRDYYREIGLVVSLFLMALIFGLINPLYLTQGSLISILDQATIFGLMGLGMTFIIISGEIDLSVGSGLALVGVIIAKMAVAGINPFICVLTGLVLGFLIGMLNGLIVVKLRLQSFVATLGTMSIFRGLAYVITDGLPIIRIPAEYRFIVDGLLFGGIRLSVFIFLAFAILSFILLKHTKFGNYVYAIGGNRESARLSGVNVDWIRVLIFAVGFTGTAIAAMVQLGKLGVGEASAGLAYELSAIAAVAIGGTSMAGGRGSVVGTVLGALLFSALRTGLIVSGVETFWQYVATGVVIVIATYGDQIHEKISQMSSKKALINKKLSNDAQD